MLPAMPCEGRALVTWRRATRLAPRALALFAALLGADLRAQEPLTLDRALSLAQERSGRLVAQDSAATAAREMAVVAGQRPDPTLKAGINNLPVNGADRFSIGGDFMTMRTVGVAQEFTRPAKLRARAARYERQADVASARRELALANLQRDTAMAWLDRLYQERLRDLLVTQRDETRLQIDAADAAYRGGRGSQADVFAARSSVAQMDDRIEQTARQVATARTQLARWIGLPASDPLGTPPQLDSVPLRPDDIETPLAQHPEIVVMLRQEAVAQAEADIAQADKKADVSVELMYSQRGSAYSNMVSLNVSIPLQWDQGNRQDRKVAARTATVEQMRADREEATRERVVEALALLQEWHSDRERLTRYDGSLIPLSGERTRAAIAAYRGASGSLTAVLDARRAEIDTRAERLRLEMDAARLWARLTYLLPGRHAMALAAQP